MYFLKFAWIGDETSQKSTLLRRIPSIRFQSSYLHTVGSDFAIKTVFAQHDGVRVPIKLALWDLNPSPLFRDIRALFYRGCSGGIVVFDIHRSTSLESIIQWVNELITFSGMNDIPILLLGIDNLHPHPSTVETEPSCMNALNQLEELLNQLHISYPQATFCHDVLTFRNLERLDRDLESLCEDVLTRIDDPTSGLTLANRNPQYFSNPTNSNGGRENIFQQIQGNFRHERSEHHRNVLLLDEHPSSQHHDLGLNLSKVGTECQYAVPILQVKPLYHCALHRERLILGPAAPKHHQKWYQCQTCEALLCEECYTLILQNFDGECPNANWPQPHPFRSRRLSS